ncbi:MAG TPA: peptidogalycan biosysnthesis protein [Nevskiaceae bacterium]|nr:peptidogalycan biosysnthesis protein [Nevskiaceae bacterium]
MAESLDSASASVAASVRGDTTRLPVRARRLDSITEVDAAEWDACFASADPFVHHAFLAALERHGCASIETGWTPAHGVLQDGAGKLIAAAPAYLKDHSWGEFVFDFSWADAAQRAGIRYYPKLVCAVPFTPVTGPRLGVRNAAARGALAPALVAGLRRTMTDIDASSLHVLFPEPADDAALRSGGGIERHDVQFHWRNADYADFDDFLARLTHDRRKKILRERRRVAEAGLRLEWQRGDELSEAAWHSVFTLYAHTYLERGEQPYLNLPFFLDYGRQPGTPLRIVSVHDGARRVAAAIFALGGNTLYGRHWGAAAHYDSLHFETCYYQGVDYCIRHRLSHFDAGAQGAHKLVRGFAPETTSSWHWLADPRLARAVARALQAEGRQVAVQRDALAKFLPYRHTAAGPQAPESHPRQDPSP